MVTIPYFIRVFVIGVGFVSGFWIAIGVNPEAEITGAFAEALESILPGSGVAVLLIPVISLAVSLFVAYGMGGLLGLAAIGVACIGGAILVRHPISSLFVTGIAIVLGLVASRNRA